MDLLTSAEAAAYLRLKERKLYELVAQQAVPCTKVTGRWLFPRAALDRWLMSGLVGPAGMAADDPPPIVGGSHDPLLDWALRESQCGLASLAEGSESGLDRMERSEVVAAAIHLHDLDDASADQNPRVVATRAGLRDVVLIAVCEREQGLVVASGNPLGLSDLASARAAEARVAVRPEGAGAQLLLLALLRAAGLSLDDMRRGAEPCPTGADIAQAVRFGRADCGIATRAVADGAGLGFVPLVWERFDLAMRQRDYFRPPLQALLRFVASPPFAARAQELTGYRTDGAGTVRYAR
jgi:putative molybdopterin biosynthesis protein